MPYYLVERTHQYTETVAIRADNEREAKEDGDTIGIANKDDTWYDSEIVEELSEEEYEQKVEEGYA